MTERGSTHYCRVFTSVFVTISLEIAYVFSCLVFFFYLQISLSLKIISVTQSTLFLFWIRKIYVEQKKKKRIDNQLINKIIGMEFSFSLDNLNLLFFFFLISFCGLIQSLYLVIAGLISSQNKCFKRYL